MKNVFCPISDERVNENVTRINAFLTVVLVITSIVIESPMLMAFLAVDFFIRGFTKARFSPLSCVSYWLSKAFKLQQRMIDKAPKVFAARMGLAMTALITVLFAYQLTTAAIVIAGILTVFATLEFAFAFCAGCTIYTYLILPFYKE